MAERRYRVELTAPEMELIADLLRDVSPQSFDAWKARTALETIQNKLSIVHRDALLGQSRIIDANRT